MPTALRVADVARGVITERVRQTRRGVPHPPEDWLAKGTGGTMGMINSSLRAENQALRDEVQFLRKALAEARQRAGFPSDDVEEPVFTERPTKVQILKERRSSLGELPFIGRAEKIVEGVLPLAAAFDKFDGDGSGGIDGNELRAALEYLGVPVTSEQASSIRETPMLEPVCGALAANLPRCFASILLPQCGNTTTTPIG